MASWMKQALEIQANWSLRKDKNFVNKNSGPIKERPARDRSSGRFGVNNIEDLIGFIEEPLGAQTQTLKSGIKWIVETYLRRGIEKVEDIRTRALPLVTNFDRLNRTGKLKLGGHPTNLQQYKTLTDLHQVVSRFDKVEPSNKQQEQEFLKEGKVEILYNDEDYKVVTPKSRKAACYYGANTEWCTAGRDYNEFKHYNKQGPLYIFLDKKRNKRWQFHWRTKDGRFEARDENDRSIKGEINSFLKRYPILTEVFNKIQFFPVYKPKTREELDKLIRTNPRAYKAFKNLPADIQVDVYDYTRNISQNPKPELQRRIAELQPGRNPLKLLRNFDPQYLEPDQKKALLDPKNRKLLWKLASRDPKIFRLFDSPLPTDIEDELIENYQYVFKHVTNISPRAKLAYLKQKGVKVFIGDGSSRNAILGTNLGLYQRLAQKWIDKHPALVIWLPYNQQPKMADHFRHKHPGANKGHGYPSLVSKPGIKPLLPVWVRAVESNKKLGLKLHPDIIQAVLERLHASNTAIMGPGNLEYVEKFIMKFGNEKSKELWKQIVTQERRR